MLADAEGKAEDLLALIGDLLEVSRIEEATMTLDLQPIAPAALLNEIVHEWSIRFQQEGATASDRRRRRRAGVRGRQAAAQARDRQSRTERAHALGDGDHAAAVGAPRRRRHSVHRSPTTAPAFRRSTTK